MSARTNLKLVTLTSLLLIAAACGNKKSSSHAPASQPEPQPEAVTTPDACEGLSCMTSVNWKLVLQGQDFPLNARVVINDVVAVDECLGSKQKYHIDRTTAPQSLTLTDFPVVPKHGQVKIQILEQNHDCSNETSFYSNENVEFEVVKNTVGADILVNLAR